MKNFLKGLALVGLLAAGLSACNCKRKEAEEVSRPVEVPAAPAPEVAPSVPSEAAPVQEVK